jgi:hypothetical protein
MLTQIISNRAKKFIRNAFELSVLKPENSNSACVHTKPPHSKKSEKLLK